MRRMSDLLTKAADALDDGQDPLHGSFLSEHEVTLDEAYDMADYLAVGARIMAWVIENPHDAATVFRGGADGLALSRITETLRRMNAQAED